MSGWAHEIVAIERPGCWDSCGARLTKEEQAGEMGPRVTMRSMRVCGRAGLFFGTFLYVTGRRGRVSARRVTMCARHAEAWTEKHGLQLPAASETQDQADARLRQRFTPAPEPQA